MKKDALFHPTRRKRQPYICHLWIYLGCERQKSSLFGLDQLAVLLHLTTDFFDSFLSILWYHLKMQKKF